MNWKDGTSTNTVMFKVRSFPVFRYELMAHPLVRRPEQPQRQRHLVRVVPVHHV